MRIDVEYDANGVARVLKRQQQLEESKVCYVKNCAYLLLAYNVLMLCRYIVLFSHGPLIAD